MIALRGFALTLIICLFPLNAFTSNDSQPVDAAIFLSEEIKNSIEQDRDAVPKELILRGFKSVDEILQEEKNRSFLTDEKKAKLYYYLSGLSYEYSLKCLSPLVPKYKIIAATSIKESVELNPSNLDANKAYFIALTAISKLGFFKRKFISLRLDINVDDELELIRIRIEQG